HKTAHVVLFSSDLTLNYAQLIDYYRLRFQLEFNFRDAKQYWGLEDFMSVKEQPVYNSANLAMFMVNVSQALMRPMRAQWPVFSVHDLKAWFRGRKYVIETLKLLPTMPDALFIPTASFNSLSNVLVRKGVVTSRSWLTEDTLRWSWDPTSSVSSGAGTFGGETEV